MSSDPLHGPLRERNRDGESSSLALCYWDPSNAEHLEQAASISCLQSSPLSLSVQQCTRVHKLTYSSPPSTYPVYFATLHSNTSTHFSLTTVHQWGILLKKSLGTSRSLGLVMFQNQLVDFWKTCIVRLILGSPGCNFQFTSKKKNLCTWRRFFYTILIFAFHTCYLREIKFVFLKSSPKNDISIIYITLMLFQTCIVFFCERQMMIFWRMLDTKQFWWHCTKKKTSHE